MAWPVDMSLTSGGTSSEPNEKSLPELETSEALEMVFSRAAACLSSMTGSCVARTPSRNSLVRRVDGVAATSKTLNREP